MAFLVENNGKSGGSAYYTNLTLFHKGVKPERKLERGRTCFSETGRYRVVGHLLW